MTHLADHLIRLRIPPVACYSPKAPAVLNHNQKSCVGFGMLMMPQMGENMWQYGQMMMQDGMIRVEWHTLVAKAGTDEPRDGRPYSSAADTYFARTRTRAWVLALGHRFIWLDLS